MHICMFMYIFICIFVYMLIENCEHWNIRIWERWDIEMSAYSIAKARDFCPEGFDEERCERV